VYYETFPTIEEAKFGENRLKAGSRKKKMQLINQFNPDGKIYLMRLSIIQR
jgi:putative endonuclease